MSKQLVVLLAVLLLAVPCMAENSELTGVLKKTVKALSPYELELDGATGSVYLRGDTLKDIPEGTRIWVKGEFHTLFYDNSKARTPVQMPCQWHIFMVVKEHKKISKLFEIPTDREQQNKQVEAMMAGNHSINLNGLLPEKWSITEITLDAVPYNWSIKPGGEKGIAVTFSGPSLVKGLRGLNNAQESFTVWFMPSSYEEIKPNEIAQFEEAKLIGRNERMKIFVACFVTDIPSWKKWKEDIVKHFQLEQENI